MKNKWIGELVFILAVFFLQGCVGVTTVPQYPLGADPEKVKELKTKYSRIDGVRIDGVRVIDFVPPSAEREGEDQ